ncbi:MAG: GNAT family N-acetyltransferase [Actinomycetota bacterium]
MRRTSIAPEPLVVGEYVVRKYEISDAQALVVAVTASHGHLEPWMPWMKFEPQTVLQREELIRMWMHAWENRSEFVMGIFHGDRVVGGTGFHLRGAENTVEIGYWVHVDYLGRGIATQVSRTLTETAFTLWPEIDTVEIHHDEANVSSGRVPERLGFRHVATGQREPEAPNETGVVYRWEKKRIG